MKEHVPRRPEHQHHERVYEVPRVQVPRLSSRELREAEDLVLQQRERQEEAEPEPEDVPDDRQARNSRLEQEVERVEPLDELEDDRGEEELLELDDGPEVDAEEDGEGRGERA